MRANKLKTAIHSMPFCSSPPDFSCTVHVRVCVCALWNLIGLVWCCTGEGESWKASTREEGSEGSKRKSNYPYTLCN